MSNYDDYDDYEDYADYTDPDLTRHKKCDTVKWVLTLVGFILVAVMLVGIICGWFTPKETPTMSEPEVTESGAETGGMYIPEAENGTGISLVSAVIPVSQYEEYGVMPIAESAQTLTATVQPEEAAPVARITWTAAWKSGNGGGKDVSEFLTLSFGNDIDTSKRCTVSCLQAFTTQIIITASVVDQPEISTAVTVDYIRRLESYEFQFNGDGISTDGRGENYVFGASDTNFVVRFVFSAGTKYPDLENPESHHLYIKLDATFKNLLDKNMASSAGITYTDKAMLHNDLDGYGDNFSDTYHDSEDQYEFYPDSNFASPAAAFLTGASAGNPDHIKKFNSVFASTINEANRSGGYHASLTTDDTINFSFNGKSYGSASGTTYQFKFSMDGLKILADSISPSQGSIYF